MKRSSFLGMCLAALPGAALLCRARNAPPIAEVGVVQAPMISHQCGTQLREHLFRIAEGASGFKPTWADYSSFTEGGETQVTVMFWDEHWRAVRKVHRLHRSVGVVGRKSELAYQISKAIAEAGIDLAEINGHDWRGHRARNRGRLPIRRNGYMV